MKNILARLPALRQRAGDASSDSFMKRIRLPSFSMEFWRRRFSIPLLITGLYLSITVPQVFDTELVTFNDKDEARYHYITILDFRREWPKLDLIHYKSATTPLYHIVMAGISFLTGPDLIRLRLVHLLFGIACLLVIYRYLKLRIGRRKGALFSILLLVSPYFIGPATRLSTDPAAFCFAALAIYELDTQICCTCRPMRATGWILLAALIRQVYAWLILFYILVYWLPKDGKTADRSGFIRYLVPILAPLCVMGYFLLAWGGLTPPLFAEHTKQHINGDVPVYVFSLFGLYSFFWAGHYLSWRRGFRIPMLFLAGMMLLSWIYLAVNPIFYMPKSGMGGLLWKLSDFLPKWHKTSILFWLLFPLGIYTLTLFYLHLYRMKDFFLMTCFPMWLASNMLNTTIYQKYYDPFLFFFLGCGLQGSAPSGRRFLFLPLLLIVLFVGIMLMRSA
jgi:hypothetical protein